MTLKWIQSEGGPLLFLPGELLSQWKGVSTADYQRACEVIDEIAPLRVGNGVGLVLGDEPHRTAWIGADDGGFLVRWIYADDESGVLAALRGVRENEFESSGVEFVVGPSCSCVLLDSAYAGDASQAERLELSLSRGPYSVSSATLTPNERTSVLVHRLKRATRGRD